NFKNANLQGASLRACIFVNADLTGADLSYANIAGANLLGATGFDPNQPGIWFGDGSKDFLGNYTPYARTILPDGTYKTGGNPGTSPVPSVPAKLHFSADENNVH